MTDLGTFEGSKVARTTLAIRNAGDGLSEALKVDPQLLHQGDVVFVVLECKVGPVNFKPIKDSSETEREHVLRAGAAAIVDEKLVKTAVEAQTEKIIEAREREKGIQQLPTNENLVKAHDKGDHAHAPYIGCPECFPDNVSIDGTAKKLAATMTNTARSTKTSKPRAARPKKSTGTATPRKSTAKK